MKKIILALLGALGVGTSSANDENLDLSFVDSRDKAVELAREGKLHKILLFPQEFGGQDVEQNVVYVPAGIPELKDQITSTLIKLVQDGSIDNLKVEPEYKGTSFVPAKIKMHTSHSSSDKKGQFNPVIDIW